MAAKKEAAHAQAFEKGTDPDKLAATSEQYQEQTGQADEPKAGPDPIIEAIAKQDAEADHDPVRDQEQVQQDLDKEIAEAEAKDD